MGSKNITCSVLRSIWSCTKDETKSLTGQKSGFAFCALEAGGGGSCWAQFSNAPLLLFYQQSLPGSVVGVSRQQGRVFTLWLARPLTLQPFPFLPCVLAHPFRHFPPPARSCLFSPCQPPDSSYPLSAFAVGSRGGCGLPLPAPGTLAQAQLLLSPCVTSSSDCIWAVCVQCISKHCHFLQQLILCNNKTRNDLSFWRVFRVGHVANPNAVP